MTNSDKDKVSSKIKFLETQLASLDHYLPETYEYLIQEIDFQKRILVEFEITDAFAFIDQEETRT